VFDAGEVIHMPRRQESVRLEKGADISCRDGLNYKPEHN